MTNEPAMSMEMIVATAIGGAPKSREGLEAERGEDQPPMSDQEVFLENMTEIVRRQGVVIAQLAIAPDTRAELQASMPDAVNRIPAWLEAKVYGPPVMTIRLFIRGLSQLLGEHRIAIERVVAEQVRDPEPIQVSLDEAALPAGDDDESNSELIAAFGKALHVHLEALIDIARDLDERMGLRTSDFS